MSRKNCLILTLTLCVALTAQAQTLELEDVQLNLISERDVALGEPGIVENIPVKVGDLVTKDQLLAQMDVRLLDIQREAALVEAQLAELATRNDVDFRFAQKSLEVAEAEYRRGLDANQQFPKSVSKTELDQAKLVTDRSKLAAEQAQRDLESARISLRLKCKQVALIDQRLEMMKVRAPATGMIVEVYPQSGEFLAAGAPVARLIQLDRLRVRGLVDGKKYDRSLLGAPVTLTVELPPNNTTSTFSGKVTFVSPEMNPVTAQVGIYADIENAALKLRPGMRGQLTIDLAGDRDSSFGQDANDGNEPSLELNLFQ